MKDFKNELRKSINNPFLLQVIPPYYYFLSLNLNIQSQYPPQDQKTFSDLELSPSEFLSKFSEFSRDEFNLYDTTIFLKHLVFEAAIEKTFQKLLNDYKNSFNKLKQPILNDEFTQFIKEKETPLKLFFQYLKEYLLKLTNSTSIYNYELLFLTKSYDNCSICDIFAITQDFSLKYNISYIHKQLKFNILKL